jgi:hypothetical protein
MVVDEKMECGCKGFVIGSTISMSFGVFCNELSNDICLKWLKHFLVAIVNYD